MLDALLRSHIEPVLAPATARIAAARLSVSSLRTVGFVLGIGALPYIGHRAYLFGLGLIALGRLFEAAAGAVARARGESAFSSHLGRVLDLLWTASFPFAFALGQPDRALAAMFMLIGLVARTASLTAAQEPNGGPAGIVLEAGANLLGKTELFIAFALACFFPDWFSIIAYLVGMLCFVMAGCRVATRAAGQHS
jgi:phosphatidylglycerophosphate synthase